MDKVCTRFVQMDRFFDAPIAARWMPPTGAVFLSLAVTRDGSVSLMAGMLDGKREKVGACCPEAFEGVGTSFL